MCRSGIAPLRKTARLQHHIDQLLSAVPRHAAGETVESRRGHPNAAVDVHQVVPGAAVRCAADRDAVLHLCGDWHAGEFFEFVNI